MQWINWSDVMGKKLPKFTKPAGAGDFDMQWSDQFVVKVGAQYEIPTLKALKVRAGYNYGKAPLDSKNFQANMAFPAVSAQHFTVGAGYDIGKLGRERRVRVLAGGHGEVLGRAERDQLVRLEDVADRVRARRRLPDVARNGFSHRADGRGPGGDAGALLVSSSRVHRRGHARAGPS